MMNKPPGVVSATEDPRERTVLDLLDGTVRKGIFPAGRLDKDTVGLLLLTNDGELAHKLLSPAHHVDKRYLVRVKGELKGSDVELFKKGIDIGDDTPTMPAELHIKSSGEISEAEVVIREGRYHQIKRMFSAIGAEVIYLKRLSMGLLLLDPDLPEGAYRPLTDEELYKLSR
jgi:16S rRNA pseudouridine516 synthase